MENNPTAAAPASTGETVATPNTNTNTEPMKASESNSVDLHGFTQEDLAGMRTFIDNNGGWDKIKSRISNPEKPVEKPVENSQSEPQKTEEPTSHTQAQPAEPKYQRPTGARTLEEINTRRYFKDLSQEPKYAPIAKQIEDGTVLKEADALGIVVVNPDYSINEERLLKFLDLKAQTVPAKPTNSEPNASAAPTVSYTEVGENGFTDINQAYKVLMEPGNPNIAKAEEFIKNHFNPNSGKK